MQPLKNYTLEEVSRHNSENDALLVIDGKVYNVTKFLNLHPGGKNILLSVAGTDATDEFLSFHKAILLKKYENLVVGIIEDPGDNLQHIHSKIVISRYEGISESKTWCIYSPYYNESHHRFRKAMCAFVDREVTPYVSDWDEARELPYSELRRKAFVAGWLPGVIGGPWPVEYVGDQILGGIQPSEWNAFHELILFDELSRCGSGGLTWGYVGGLLWSFINQIRIFGSQFLKDKIIKPVLTGEKHIALCITEPQAGSDVGGLQSTAIYDKQGQCYILNGQKKFITNGTFADFFIVAAKTHNINTIVDGGQNSLSVFFVERQASPGLKTRPMKCTGMWASGTAYVTFEDVKVPKVHLIGEERQGFKYIVWNFNHERWTFLVMCIRFCRVCYEESFRYAVKRKTFGKPLLESPVIRAKLGTMIRQIEGADAWLHLLTYQMTRLSHEEQNQKLSGPIALLKCHITMLLEQCAREAIQVFGGLGYTRGNGQGGVVERLFRDVKGFALGGGSEEILLDYGIRQAMKYSKL